MNRMFLFLMPLLLVACTPGSYGPNAPLFVTDAPTVLRPITPDSALARRVVDTCLTNNGGEAVFQQGAAGTHFGAMAAVIGPLGDCGYYRSYKRDNSETAIRDSLGRCENTETGCVAVLVAEPNVTIPRGARTVPQALSEWILSTYLTSTGYGAIAMADGGAWSASANYATAEEAEQAALQDCASIPEYTLVGPINSSTEVVLEDRPCRIINRRTPDGVNTPQILQ